MEKNKKIIILLIPVIILVILVQAYYVIGVTQSNIDSNSEANSGNVYSEPVERKNNEYKPVKEQKNDEISVQTNTEAEPVFGSKEYFELKNKQNTKFVKNKEDSLVSANPIVVRPEGQEFEEIKALEPLEEINENLLKISIDTDENGKVQELNAGNDYVLDDIDMSSYVSATQQRIGQHWHPAASKTEQKVVAQCTLSRNGKLKASKITKSSGDKDADTAVLNAISKTSFVPLPPKYKSQTIDVEFSFDNRLKKASNTK